MGSPNSVTYPPPTKLNNQKKERRSPKEVTYWSSGLSNAVTLTTSNLSNQILEIHKVLKSSLGQYFVPSHKILRKYLMRVERAGKKTPSNQINAHVVNLAKNERGLDD